MKNNQKTDASRLEGINIYHDRGRTYYCMPFSNKAYMITNSDAKTYYLYSLRLFFCVCAGALIKFFYPEATTISILSSFVLYIILTILFIFIFLRKLQVVKNFKKPEKDSYFMAIAKASSFGKIFIAIVVGVILGISMIVNAYMENYIGLMLYGSYLFGAFFILLGISLIYSLILKKKMEK